MRGVPEEEVEVANGVSYTLDSTLSYPEALSVLKDLAVEMFVVGSEASVVFGGLQQLAGTQSVRVWKLVKQAIHDVYESKQHRSSICRSPERPDLRLAQEEANGYLAGAVFGIELLASEARAVGKNVDNCVAAERKAATSKEPFKTQRRPCRKLSWSPSTASARRWLHASACTRAVTVRAMQPRTIRDSIGSGSARTALARVSSDLHVDRSPCNASTM